MIKITKEFAIAQGWDEDLISFEDFKEMLLDALKRGWNPDEETYLEFEMYNMPDEDIDVDYIQRRIEAIKLGWKENEMDLDEFEALINKDRN